MLPISLALPWGLNIGDLLGHMPLPAKITIEVLAPIDLREQFGDEPDIDEVYDHVTRRHAGDARRARRRAALPGDRLMRLNESIVISAPPKLVWDYIADPDNALHLHVRRHPLGGRGRAAHRASAPGTGC